MGKKESEQTVAESDRAETIKAKDADSKSGASKNGKKKWIIAGVVVVIIVAACVGGMIWHEQPSFCGTICHEPMDTYLASYESAGSTALAKTHANAGKTCLDCHEAKISEQMTEGVAWITDGFTVDEDGYLADEEINVDGSQLCLGCHSEADIVAATVDFEGNEGYNPHSNHQTATDLDCEDCHSMHGTQTLTCTACHDLKVPEGWESVDE